jgi:hypothetical protein
MRMRTVLIRLTTSALALGVAGAIAIVGRDAQPAMGATAGHSLPLNVVAPNIDAPGLERVEQQPGWSQRLFDLAAGDGIDAASVTVTPVTGSPLAAQLQLTIDVCPSRWTVDRTGTRYSCATGARVLAGPQPAYGRMELRDLHVPAGGVAYLRAFLAAPPDAAPGQTATLDYEFTTTT